MNSRFASVVHVLAEADPRSALQRTLRAVMDRCQARSGAVLAVEGGALTAVATEDVNLRQLGATQALFEHETAALEKGERIATDSVLVQPITDLTTRVLIGVLCLWHASEWDSDWFEPFAVALASALRLRHRPALTGSACTDFESCTSAELERKHLMHLLERNEWNIARVARILGITRRTVYLRLKRHGIERLRIPKTAPSRPGEA